MFCVWPAPVLLTSSGRPGAVLRCVCPGGVSLCGAGAAFVLRASGRPGVLASWRSLRRFSLFRSSWPAVPLLIVGASSWRICCASGVRRSVFSVLADQGGALAGCAGPPGLDRRRVGCRCRSSGAAADLRRRFCRGAPKLAGAIFGGATPLLHFFRAASYSHLSFPGPTYSQLVFPGYFYVFQIFPGRVILPAKISEKFNFR